MRLRKEQYVLGLLRITLGLIFLWAFFDKVFGLGFATEANKAWIMGESPTSGFLTFSTTGPLSSFYQSIAGNIFVDWIFMIGTLLIGLALLLGIFVKIAGYSGVLLNLLMWSAVLPPAHHPFLDEHIIYALVLFGLTIVKSGSYLGLGKWWANTKLVKQHFFLE